MAQPLAATRSSAQEKARTMVRRFYSTEERDDASVEQELYAAGAVLQLVLGKRFEAFTEAQQAALLSLVADLVGGQATCSGAFADSNLVIALRKELLQLAAAEFFAFAQKDGKVVKQLWDKRNCEQLLFRRGVFAESLLLTNAV